MISFKFDSAIVTKKKSTWLCIKVDNQNKAINFVESMKGKPFVAEIKQFREKRSLDANAYFWILCSKLAEHTGISREEVYKECIKNIGGNSETVCIQDKAVDKLIKGWTHNGLGWITETFPSKLDGCTNVVLYYGSSTYDTKQMSRLIDNIIQDCKSVGIETMTPEQLQLLKENWK